MIFGQKSKPYDRVRQRGRYERERTCRKGPQAGIEPDVAAFRTEPIRSSLCPVNPLGGPNTYCIFRERPEGFRRIDH